MATHWVDITDGDDANGGTSYADAVQTLPAAHDLLEADADTTVTLNVVNSGTYNLTANTTETYVSTGATSQTFTIRGVDSAGDPALVTVESLAVGTSQRFFQFWRGNVVYENFYVDYTPSAVLSGTQYFQDLAGTGDIGDLTLNYCHFRAYAYGSVGANQPTNQIWDPTAGRQGEKNFNYCVFENMLQGVSPPMVVNQLNTSVSIDHCVILDSYSAHTQHAGLLNMGVGGPAGDSLVFTNNTIAAQWDPASGTINELIKLSYTSGGAMNECSIHDNVILLDNIGGSNDATVIRGLFYGHSSGSPAVTATVESIGYNVVYGGVDFPWADFTNGIYYEGIFEGLAADPVATDSTSFGSATEDTLFKDMASTYAWEVNGGAVTLTVPADARLVAEDASGTGGAPPGALPLALVNPSIVATTADALYVAETDVVNVLFTYTEDATTGATGSTVVITIPDEFDYVQDAASSGSYNSTSKTWTLGTLAGGATATLTLRLVVNTFVATDYDLTVTGTITTHGSGLDLGINVADDVAFLGFAGAGGDDDPGIPGSPSRVPLLDVMPTTEPRFFLDVNQKIQTKRNREKEIYTRYDEEDIQFSEFRSGVLLLATNTSATYNMGGLERANYFMYEADNAVQLAINGGTFLPAAKQVAVTQGAITSLKFQNTSTSTDAEIFILVVD